MKKLVLVLIVLMFTIVLLQAQLDFYLEISSATTQMIQGTVRIYNNNAVTYTQTVSHFPYLHLGVDGAVEAGWWPMMGELQIPAHSYIEQQVSCSHYSTPLEPGLHFMQVYSSLGGGAYPVGNVVSMPIGFTAPQPIAWTLHPDEVDRYGLRMRLELQNLATHDWSYGFILNPFIRVSINGVMVPQSHTFNTTQVYLIQNESCYFDIEYQGDLPQGDYEIQAHIHLNDWEAYIPVGEPITVSIGDEIATHIGTGADMSRIPVDFWWRNSLYQCIYDAEDLGDIAGYITAIGFRSDYVVGDYDYEAVHIKLLLGATTQSHLIDGWIGADEQDLVYDGAVSFPEGQQQILITLDEPFLLPLNRNLAMTVERDWQLSYASSAKPFWSDSCLPIMARKAFSDAVDLDAFNPPGATDAHLTPFRPYLTVYYIPAEVSTDDPLAPASPAMELQAYPNPFNPSTTISFELKDSCIISLDIFNLRGQRVETLVSDQMLTRGKHELVWNAGAESPSGIYYIRLRAGNSTKISKVILNK